MYGDADVMNTVDRLMKVQGTKRGIVVARQMENREGKYTLRERAFWARVAEQLEIRMGL